MGLRWDNFLRHGACLVLSSPLDMGGFWRSPAPHPRQNLVQYPPPPGTCYTSTCFLHVFKDLQASLQVLCLRFTLHTIVPVLWHVLWQATSLDYNFTRKKIYYFGSVVWYTLYLHNDLIKAKATDCINISNLRLLCIYIWTIVDLYCGSWNVELNIILLHQLDVASADTTYCDISSHACMYYVPSSL